MVIKSSFEYGLVELFNICPGPRRIDVHPTIRIQRSDARCVLSVETFHVCRTDPFQLLFNVDHVLPPKRVCSPLPRPPMRERIMPKARWAEARRDALRLRLYHRALPALKL